MVGEMKLASEWEGKKSIHADGGGKRAVAPRQVCGMMDHGRPVAACLLLCRVEVMYSPTPNSASYKEQMHDDEVESSAGGTPLEAKVRQQPFDRLASSSDQRQYSGGPQSVRTCTGDLGVEHRESTHLCTGDKYTTSCFCTLAYLVGDMLSHCFHPSSSILGGGRFINIERNHLHAAFSCSAASLTKPYPSAQAAEILQSGRNWRRSRSKWIASLFSGVSKLNTTSNSPATGHESGAYISEVSSSRTVRVHDCGTCSTSTNTGDVRRRVAEHVPSS